MTRRWQTLAGCDAMTYVHDNARLTSSGTLMAYLRVQTDRETGRPKRFTLALSEGNKFLFYIFAILSTTAATGNHQKRRMWYLSKYHFDFYDFAAKLNFVWGAEAIGKISW